MPAKRKEKPPEYPKEITFGSGRVRISKRSNGFFALGWRELGSNRTTTKASESKAITWAQKKARELDAGSGNQWVNAGAGEILKELQSIAGEGEGSVRRLLEEMKAAKHHLGSIDGISTAAKYFAEHGPLKISRSTMGATVQRFLSEYQDAEKSETYKTFGGELNAFLKADPLNPDLALTDLTEDMLRKWVDRKVTSKKKPGTFVKPAPRTLKNRITTWITFLNRARDWKLLTAGKHVAEILRRPTIPDAGKEIFTVPVAKALLAAVRAKRTRLEAYLLVAGWLGLRPSECQRLTWDCFEWDRGYLHVTVKVAGKTSQERYVPIDPRLLHRLRKIYVEGKYKPTDRIGPFRAREFLSAFAREEKIILRWPADVLRHSFCSYRLALTENRAKVAEEAGNSPQIIKTNYRRPLRKEDGEAWWDLLEEVA